MLIKEEADHDDVGVANRFLFNDKKGKLMIEKIN